MTFDIVIKGGRVVDGSGIPWFKANIGINDGKITAVSRRKIDDVEKIIKANGLVVAPGFINPHGHFGREIHEENVVLQSLMQGVTLETTGTCGYAVHTMSKNSILSESYDWKTLQEWREKLEALGIGLNLAPFIGLGTIRTSVMGIEGEGGERYRPTSDEMKEMEDIVREGMEDGAFGFTVGLNYEVQKNASTNEIVSLTKIVSEYGGVFMAHGRGKEWIQEFIEICESTPIPGSWSHTALAQIRKNMAYFYDARDRGVEVFFDCYPWMHGSGKSLGYWFLGHQFGKIKTPMMKRFKRIKDLDDPIFKEMAKRLEDEAEWAKIKAECIERIRILEEENEERRNVLEASGSNLVVAPLHDVKNLVGIVYSPSHPEFEGDDINMPADLEDVKNALGSEDFWEAARELFIADKGKTLVVNAHGKLATARGKVGKRERHVIASYQLPEAMVCSDASHYITHPRGWGTWPKILQRYVRELNVLKLEQAVKKMTSLPAQFIGITDRGLIRQGNWADIVLFDPKNIMNKASYKSPREYPEGIPYVLVNGEVVVEEGSYTGALPGKVLRKHAF